MKKFVGEILGGDGSNYPGDCEQYDINAETHREAFEKLVALLPRRHRESDPLCVGRHAPQLPDLEPGDPGMGGRRRGRGRIGGFPTPECNEGVGNTPTHKGE